MMKADCLFNSFFPTSQYLQGFWPDLTWPATLSSQAKCTNHLSMFNLQNDCTLHSWCYCLARSHVFLRGKRHGPFLQGKRVPPIHTVLPYFWSLASGIHMQYFAMVLIVCSCLWGGSSERKGPVLMNQIFLPLSGSWWISFHLFTCCESSVIIISSNGIINIIYYNNNTISVLCNQFNIHQWQMLYSIYLRLKVSWKRGISGILSTVKSTPCCIIISSKMTWCSSV